MAKNTDFHKAKKNKKDEFYTQLTDIEQELKHYKDKFKGKVVYCNCDDPRSSKFFHYFSYNFEFLGLKKLIATCYKSQSSDLFSKHDSETAVYMEYNGDKNGNRIPDTEEIEVKQLKGDGDFRSPECIELLKEADIVVTNPPFSLFREYVSQLIEYDKKFLILGTSGVIIYKDFSPLVKENKVWLGPSIHSGDREFEVPDHYELNASGSRIDDKGKKYIRVKGVRWWTNLDHKNRYDNLILYKKYTPEDYPKYDNFDAINVNKVKDIPCDYTGAMGVPITFLDKYNPAQFEILGMDRVINKKASGKATNFYLEGKELYSRILIKRKEPKLTLDSNKPAPDLRSKLSQNRKQISCGNEEEKEILAPSCK